MATIGEIAVDIKANLDGLKKGLAEANKLLAGLSNNVGGSGAKLNNSFDKLGKTISGIFTADLILDFGKTLVGLGSKIISTSAEFEKLGAVLANTFGSKTAGLIAQFNLQKLAQELPSSLLELSGAFLKLQNAGIKPTTSDMKAFSDVASNAGKGIDQFAEAVNDAARGEFERLKEFFISAKKSGDSVIFTFNNVDTAVKNNAESIKAYLVSIGQLDGVLGASAVQMATVSGKISNMNDAFDNLFNTIGKGNRGLIAASLDFIIEKVNAIADALQSVEDRGLSNAAAGISAQFKSLQEDFNNTAKTAKESGKDIGIALADMAAAQQAFFEPKLVEAQAKLNKFLEENDTKWANLSRNVRNATDEYKVHTDTIAKLSGDVQLFKAVLGELPIISEKAVKSLEPLKSLDLRNSLERVNDELEKFYAVLGNPDASNSAVANGAKRIKALETERERLQEVIDARVKFFNIKVPDSLSRGQQPLQGIGTTGPIIDPDRFFSDEALAKIKAKFADLRTTAIDAVTEIDQKAAAIAQSIAASLGEMTSSLAEGIGNALSGVDNAMGGAFTSVLTALANLAIMVGRIAIGVAIGIEGIKKALESLNPYAALIAGIALIALGTLAKNALSKAAKTPSLATGTNYMPSDGLAFLHQGEAVIPKKFNPDAFGGGMGGGEVVFTIYGDTLKGVLRNNDRRRDRTG